MIPSPQPNVEIRKPSIELKITEESSRPSFTKDEVASSRRREIIHFMCLILMYFSFFYFNHLKGFATFWEFSFYGQKKVADYEYHSLFAEKIHFHT